MSALEKARLEVLDRNGRVTESFPVQFNPATMTLTMSNSIDGGQSRGRQTQQYNGTSSTTLSLDLEFDTSDEGTADRPVDVRRRTAVVAQFVLPGGTASKQAPPRLKFRWGTFELVGVMSSLTEELSYFAASGAPLRSKVTCQIKEQDPRFEALERGPGANRSRNAQAAGEAASPGAPVAPAGPADTAVPALAGETPADFLARNGLAPEAWRALGGALDALADGIELEAGFSVEFDSSLTVGTGLGVSVGFAAGIDVSAGVALGLEGGARDAVRQGLALSAAGGLTAAAEAAASGAAASAVADARARFGVATSGAAARTGTAATPATAGTSRAVAGASRRPLSATPSARTQPPTPAAPAPPPPVADRRAATYGSGVPLRDRVVVPGAVQHGYVLVHSQGSVTARSPRDRSAPWDRPAPTVSPAPQRDRHGGRCACGCGGHRGGGRP